MNGNGDATDEIPLLGSPSSWGSNPVKYLTNAFVASQLFLIMNENPENIQYFLNVIH